MIAVSEHIMHRLTLITMKSILTVPIDLETKHMLRTFQEKKRKATHHQKIERDVSKKISYRTLKS